jgi:putative membrane protein
MTNKLLILLSGSALALAACNKHDNANESAAAGNATDMNMAADNGMAMDNNMMANSAAATASPLTAQGFAHAAAASDRFEIESSRLAEASGSSAAVKKFAAKMITDHTKSTAKLKSTAAAMSPPLTVDDTLAPDQQQMLDSLKGLKGAEFDTAYAAAQVDAHQKTLDALKAYAASGDNSQLKSFANDTIPIVTAHLNMAKGLK